MAGALSGPRKIVFDPRGNDVKLNDIEPVLVKNIRPIVRP